MRVSIPKIAARFFVSLASAQVAALPAHINTGFLFNAFCVILFVLILFFKGVLIIFRTSSHF